MKTRGCPPNFLQKWLDYFEKDIRHEIQWLVMHNNIFKEIRQIVNDNTKINQQNIFFPYLGDTYRVSAAIAIRSQLDTDKRSISMARLLNQIENHPAIFLNIFSKNGFSGDSNACRKKSHDDLEKLKSMTDKIKIFANKWVAHIDSVKPVVPTFDEIGDCIDLLDCLYTEYYRFFHGKIMITTGAVPQYPWAREIFRMPWIND